MGWDKVTLRRGIASQLLSLGSIPLQKDLWKGKISGFTSDFSETLNSMEDYAIPDELEYFTSKDFISRVEAKKLEKIDSLINDVVSFYHDKEPSNEVIWHSQAWIDLVNNSFEVLQEHFLNDLMDCNGPEKSWYNKYCR
jgi:hypothetical protein